MRSITPRPRGMALIMAMIVIVLITMLVAGAISFTGTELAAAEVQSQESSMAACIQAARNLFVSRLQLKPGAVPCAPGAAPTDPECLNITFDVNLPGTHETPPGPDGIRPGTQLATGHLSDLASLSARQASALNNPLAGQGDDSFMTGRRNNGPMFYVVTAVCRDNSAPGSPEREIEFMVRTDL